MPIFTSIAVAIGGALGFGAASFFVTATAFVLKTVVGLGVNMLLSKLLMKDQGPSFGVTGHLQTGGQVPRMLIMGWRATAGSLVWANTWGEEKKTPNAYFTQVIALSDMPCRELVGIEVNGEKCTILFNEPHERGFPVEEYRKDGTDYLWVRFHDGNQTTADAFIRARAATPAYPYNANRVGRGICYVVATARVHEELWTGFPAFKWEVIGMPLYDISKDTTKGGVGPQRLNDPTTWGGDGDHLMAVQAYNLLRGIWYNSQWVYGLQKTTDYNLPNAWWISQIEKCRIPFEGPDGNIPSIRTSIEIPVSENPADVLEALLIGGNAKITESGGIYKLYLGEPGASVGAINDDVIISTQERTFTPFYTLENTVTGIEANYPEPLEGWNSKTSTPLYDLALEADAGDRRLLSSLSIDTVPYNAQVQKIMLQAIKEAARARRHTIVLPPEYWIYEPGDVITFNSVEHGYVDKLFRIDGVMDLDNMDVMWDITEVDPTDYDWNFTSDYVPPTFAPIGPIRPPEQNVEGWDAEPWIVYDASAEARRPAARLSWDGDQDDVDFVRYEIRHKVTGDIIESMSVAVAIGEVIVTDGILPNQIYEARGKYFAISGRPFEWTGWVEFISPNVLLNTGDLADGSITTNKLIDQAITEVKLANRAVTNLKIGLTAVTDELIANGAIVTSKLADLAVSSAKVAEAAIITSKLGNLAVSSDKLAANAVTLAKMADLSVNADKIINNSITTTKIADEAVAAGKLAANAVTSSKIASGAITLAKFQTGIEPVSIVSPLPTVKSTEVVSYNGKIYRWDGTKYTAEVDAGDISGVIDPDQLAIEIGGSNLVQDSGLLDHSGSVTWIRYFSGGGAATLSFETPGRGFGRWGKVTADASWTGLIGISSGSAVYAGVLGGWKPNTEYVISFYAKASAGAAFNGTRKPRLVWNVNPSNTIDLDNPLLSSNEQRHSIKILTGASVESNGRIYIAVDTGPIVAGDEFWVTNIQVEEGNVLSAYAPRVGEILAGTINSTEIAANAVIAGKVAAGAINADALQTNSVTAIKIAANAITAAKIDANAVTADKINANAVTTAKIAAGAVSADKIQANSISARELVVADWENLVPDSLLQDASLWLLISPFAMLTPAPDDYKSGGIGAIYTETVPSGSGWSTYVRGTNFPVSPGDSIRYSAHMRRWGTSGTAYVRIVHRLYNVDGVSLGSGVSSTMAVNTSTPTEFSTVYSVPNTPTVAFSTFEVQINRDVSSTGVIISSPTAMRQKGTNLIVDGAITADKIESNAVIADKIAANAVTSGKIAANAVQAGSISAGAVTADKIATNAVTTGKIAAGAVTANEIAASSITARHLVITDYENIITNGLLQEGNLDGWNLTGSVIGVAQKGSSTGYNTINAPWALIFPPTPNTAHQVTWAADIPVNNGDEFLISGEVSRTGPNGIAIIQVIFRYYDADGVSISSPIPFSFSRNGNGDLSPLPQSGAAIVGTANPTRLRISLRPHPSQEGTAILTNLRIMRKKSAELIVDGAIIADKIAANAVTAAKIATNAVTADKIIANAVTTVKIATGAVTANELAANSVIADKINANAVTTAKIAAGAVTALEIGAGAITAVKIDSGAITTDKIAVNAVTGDKILANSVHGNRITAGTLDATRWAPPTAGNNVIFDFLGGTSVPGIGDDFMSNPIFPSFIGLRVPTGGVGTISASYFGCTVRVGGTIRLKLQHYRDNGDNPVTMANTIVRVYRNGTQIQQWTTTALKGSPTSQSLDIVVSNGDNITIALGKPSSGAGFTVVENAQICSGNITPAVY